MSTLRQIAEDTWQGPAYMLRRLGLDADTDIDAPLGVIEEADIRQAVLDLDGLKP